MVTQQGQRGAIPESPLIGRMARRASQVRPAQGSAFEVKENQLIQFSDTLGGQVACCVAFNLNDFDETLSPAHTRAANNSLMLRQDDGLYSSRHNRMFTIIADSVGRHDMLFPACDEQRYMDDYGIEGHLNCRDNFLKALSARSYEVAPDQLPDPINWFMNVGIKGRGEFEIRQPLSVRNDNVLLKAHMDTLVVVSACPNDQNAMNSFKPTDILVRVYS
ncbi:MAG TPA: urea carboxylase-associated family protein [Thermomicrobiales bacterium]|nr:urea carboxylase-associated family protein [Thermomicrobiales bacterium]